MGFVRQKAFHTLVFDGEYAGLTIRVRALTGHGLTQLAALDPEPTFDNPTPVWPLFLESLDSWDLEYEDGGSVPLTFDALWGYDIRFIKDVLAAYLGTLGQPYPATAPGQPLIRPEAVAAPVADVPLPAYDDAPDAEDMDIPEPFGPDLSHLERFAHAIEEPIPA